MAKGPYHSDHCDFCSKPATGFTNYLSGEPVNLCAGESCRERFQKNAADEMAEMQEIELI